MEIIKTRSDKGENDAVTSHLKAGKTEIICETVTIKIVSWREERTKQLNEKKGEALLLSSF